MNVRLAASSQSPRFTLVTDMRALGIALALLAGLTLQPSHASDETPATVDTAQQRSYHSALTDDGRYRVSTRFRNFDGEHLNLDFTLASAASDASLREFGVSVAELDALLDACRQRKDCDQAEFDRQTTRYYRERALRLDQRAGEMPRLSVDVARVVQRNRERVKPVAVALRRLAQEQGRDTAWTVEAAMALVQSGLLYRQPETWKGERKILGFYPPPLALTSGYGDCDTKSALLAAILQNLTPTPIVGVKIPQHYLLALAGTPRSGQAYVVHEGRAFVLVEAAGPAMRLPGHVAPKTLAALERPANLRIDPMI
ncbi:MAG TPA: hypothetical protein VGE57_01875 [Solimonas sp.]